MTAPAEWIARALGGQRSGAGWVACCPAHEDRRPSLSITDRGARVLVHCHAGCEQRAVIAALRSRGLWADAGGARRPGVRRGSAKPEPTDRKDDERSAYALSVWEAGRPPGGTPVETYLAARGLSLPRQPVLRFHAGLKHKTGGTWPGMVALVTHGQNGAPLAIHRTFLARDEAGKAPVKPAKMMLGPCRGGAVRLAEPSEVLMVGEGIETCLSAMQVSGLPAWAALSTSGMRSLELPEAVRDVIVLADGDDAGEAAARDCALRWMRQGRTVRIARPPEGLDFNDMLLGRAPCDEASAI